MAAKKKGANCFVVGCVSLVVIGIVGVLVVFFGTRYALDKLVETYTAAAPAEIPIVEATDEEVRATLRRIEAFRQGLEQESAAEPLVLSTKDLNILIQHDPQFEEMKGRVYVKEIQNDQLRVELSFPLSGIEWDAVKDRYLNGEVDFSVAIVNGRLKAWAQNITVNGESLPEGFAEGFGNEDLLNDADFDQETEQMLRKIESITLVDGEARIAPRAGGAAPAEGGEAIPAEPAEAVEP